MSYHITDVNQQHDLIVTAFNRRKALHAQLFYPGDLVPDPFNLDVALALMRRRAAAHRFGRSKYMPHQGKTERVRRQVQMYREDFDRKLMHFGTVVSIRHGKGARV